MTVGDLETKADVVMQREGFDRGVATYAAAMTRFRLEGPPSINKLLGQDVRFRTVTFTLYLHHDAELGRPEGGATYSRLLELISGTIGGSQRVVSTTLALMQAMDFVRVEPSIRDRRVKFYRPTDKMLAVVRAWLGSLFAALDHVEPEARRSEQLAQGDDIVQRFILGVGAAFRDGESLTGRIPEFSLFFDREGGWPLLAMAIRTAHEGRALPSRGEMAKLFGLSKTQIASVISDATAAGFFHTEGDRTRATPLMLERYRRWLAVSFAFFMEATALPGQMFCAARMPIEDDRIGSETGEIGGVEPTSTTADPILVPS